MTRDTIGNAFSRRLWVTVPVLAETAQDFLIIYRGKRQWVSKRDWERR